MKVYPDTTIVAIAKTFGMMNFFRDPAKDRSWRYRTAHPFLGKHTLTFGHRPEVIVDSTILFAADGFGHFGALDVDEPWDDEATHRYRWKIRHGQAPESCRYSRYPDHASCTVPLLKENLASLRNTISGLLCKKGVAPPFTEIPKKPLSSWRRSRDKGCPKVALYDLARCDMSQAVATLSAIVSPLTYNARCTFSSFLSSISPSNYQKPTIGLIENGSWAPLAAKIMKGMFEKSKKITWLDTTVRILSSLSAREQRRAEAMAKPFCEEYMARRWRKKLESHGALPHRLRLYVVTSNDKKTTVSTP